MADSKKLYDNISFPNENLKIISYADRTADVSAGNAYAGMFHEDIEIKLFREGDSTLLVGDSTVEARPGDMVIINPYEIHTTVNLGEKKGVYYLLMIGLDFFEGDNDIFFNLRKVFIKERTKIQTHIRENVRLNEIVRQISMELDEKKPMYERVVRGLVLELFSLLLRDYKCDESLHFPHDKKIRGYELIYPAIGKIRKDFAEKISIEELASMCGVSKYHFCRTFKAITGVSPVQYQNEYRIQIADVLLKNSDKSISEIADICGFDDAAYFSRCYKKHTGISPREKRAILSK